MIHLRSRHRKRAPLFPALWLAALALLALSACSPGNSTEPEATAGSPTQMTTAVATTGSPTQTVESPATAEIPATVDLSAPTAEPGEIVAQGDVPFGPGPFNLIAPAAGLTDLAGYKATLTLSFDGTEAGQPSQWSTTYEMSHTTEPAARQLTITSTGAAADPDPVTLTEAGGASFEQRGEGACVVSVLLPGDSAAALLEPAGMLNAVIGAEAAGSETVNGVAADHYIFDERALGQSGFADSTGELWVAVDGGYVVKYLLTTTGEPGMFGQAIEGTATWAYELTSANQPIAIEPPPDCPAVTVDAPLLADATGVVNEPGLLSYTTLTSPTDVVAFYQAQLPALGWEPTADPIGNETTAWQDFSRADRQLSIIITATAEGASTVTIVQGNQLD